MIKKGIILAGGKGTRLSPLTKVLNKQLLPLYDKPLIFYPLSVLMLAEIKDILIITNKGETNLFKKILGDGRNLGIKISYKEQKKPKGEDTRSGQKDQGKRPRPRPSPKQKKKFDKLKICVNKPDQIGQRFRQRRQRFAAL